MVLFYVSTKTHMYDEEVFTIDTDQVSVNLLDHSTECIRQLYEKYAHDLYLTSKIQHYISHHLPVLIANVEESRQKSLERHQELNTVQDKFMNTFTSNNHYFYIPSNEIFFHYDGNSYSTTSEDHILHHIVTSISEERSILREWKHKTKVSTLKRIKDTSIFKTIPESNTIQNILLSCLPYFQTKKKCKYFLTILGDNILKKDLSLIHFIDPSIKTLLREINQQCILHFNVQCTQTFKYKCHEKHYDMDNQSCRIVPISDSIDDYVSDIFKYHMLDLLCVACHYSNRYNSSDDFIKIYNTDDKLNEYVFKVYNTNAESMLQEFTKEYCYVMSNQNLLSSSPIDHYIVTQHTNMSKTTNTTNAIKPVSQQISWKSMLYLWKDYLRIHKYPLNLYQPLCKQILTQNIFKSYYDEESDVFTGIGSSKMPNIYRFLKFWSETIVEDCQEHMELEIDEIIGLFRMWSNKLYQKRKVNLTEETIMDILKYYHPDIEIVDDKYIYKKRCTLWDKDMDIEAALVSLKETCTEENNTLSLYDAYTGYCNCFQNQIRVSKSYFEKYIQSQHIDNISDTGFLRIDLL